MISNKHERLGAFQRPAGSRWGREQNIRETSRGGQAHR